MIALIDGDSLIYKIGFTFEETIVWNEDEVDTEPIVSTHLDYHNAYSAIDSLIESIMFKTCSSSVQLWLTKGNNFRYTVDSTYKHNRKENRKPQMYQELFNYLVDNYNANIANGYEADDVVVYLKSTYPDEYILCAIDKDVLYQTTGYHYNYNKEEFITVDDYMATRFPYLQTLTGDQVDGYPGCKGIGAVKANKILDKAEELAIKHNIPLIESYWIEIVKTFEEKGLTEEDAITQMRLANMKQFNGKIIDLWTPLKGSLQSPIDGA